MMLGQNKSYRRAGPSAPRNALQQALAWRGCSPSEHLHDPPATRWATDKQDLPQQGSALRQARAWGKEESQQELQAPLPRHIGCRIKKAQVQVGVQGHGQRDLQLIIIVQHILQEPTSRASLLSLQVYQPGLSLSK